MIWWAMAVGGGTSTGQYDLAAATTGKAVNTYEFPWVSQPLKGETDLKGPKRDTYDYSDSLPVAYSPCGGTRTSFTFTARVTVDARKAARDSVSRLTFGRDGAATLPLGLTWREC